MANQSNPYYTEIIDHLNNTQEHYGWFSQHYGGNPENDSKKPFQLKNTIKLDGIRNEIDQMNLDETDKAVALTSLILALDKVDSTLGHYSSYLSKWSPRSYKDLKLEVPKIIQSAGNHQVIRGDIFNTIASRSFDLAYFDPPYGSNNEKMPPSRVRYASYYHIWTTVIKNDKPSLFGKVGRRADSRDTIAGSVFEEFRKDENGQHIAMEAIRKLITQTQARYILLSYSSGGRATKKELTDIIHTEGKLLKAIEIDYKHNVMGSMRWTNEWINSDQRHLEYLFLMEKK